MGQAIQKFLEIACMRLDGNTQPRCEINETAVAEYAELVAERDKFPPVVVFDDGASLWLADGFHRVHAHRRAGMPTIFAEVHSGTRRDAVLYGLNANIRHGLRETRADKRRKIEIMLGDDEWGRWSDREIGRRCGVDHKTVTTVRAELVASGEIPQIEVRTVERNGTVYSQSVHAARECAPPVPADVQSAGAVTDGARHQPAIETPAVPPAPAQAAVGEEALQQDMELEPAVIADAMTQSNDAPLLEPQVSPRVEEVSDVIASDALARPYEAGNAERLSIEGAELRQQLAELSENLTEALAENEAMARIVESDDRATAALAEVTRLREQVRVLEDRVRALMNEKNAAVREAKRWKAKAEAAEKRCGVSS